MLSNMTARSTVVCLGVALLLCTATNVQAQKPGGAGNAPIEQPSAPADEATVTVNCGAGESINDALQTAALQLNIFVDAFGGPCVENVVITRSNVLLAGANPLDAEGEPTDVIQGVPTLDRNLLPALGNVLLIKESDNVTVLNLILEQGTRNGITVIGLGLRERVFVDNCILRSNLGSGLRE